MSVRAESDTRIIATARDLAADFATRAADHDRDASFPFENFAKLHEAGLLALTVPRRYGGLETDMATICRVMEAVGGGCASTGLVLAMQYLQHSRVAANTRWPEDVRGMVARAAVEDGALLNTARVEPELGTPARGGLGATTAVRTGGGWCITGRKTYTTGSPILRYFLVWAKTDEDPVRAGWFLVPAGTPGVTFERTWDHMGMRATGSDDMVLDDAPIPAEYAVDVRAPGEWGDDSGSLAWNNLILSSLYHGVAKAGRDWLFDYLHRRVPSNLGASLATLPRLQSAAGEIEALLFTSDALIAAAARAVDSDPSSVRQVAMNHVKYVATNNAIRAMQLAVSLIANPGLTRANPLERHLRDALCGRIHTPQDDTIQLEAGRASLATVTPPPA